VYIHVAGIEVIDENPGYSLKNEEKKNLLDFVSSLVNDKSSSKPVGNSAV